MQSTPQNQPQSQSLHPQLAPLPKPKPKPWLIGAAAAVALAAGAFFTGIGPFANPPGDDMSQQQIQQITTQFAHAVADFPLVDLNKPEERAKAQAALNLPAPEVQKIMQAADNGQLRLAWVTVWDNCAEDGDIIRISSQGYSTQVGLKNSPTTVVIPVTQAGSVQLTGVYDGGGGITAAARTLAGEIPFPPLDLGTSATLPLK